LALLGRLLRMERGRERGLLPLLRQRLVKECTQISVQEFEKIQTLLEARVLPELATCREFLNNAFDAIRVVTAASCGQIGRDVKWRLVPQALALPALRAVHANEVMPAVEALRGLVQQATVLFKRLKDIPPPDDERMSPLTGDVQELGAYLARLERTANVLSEVTSAELEDNTVRWIEIDAENPHFIRLARCPLHVGKPLAEWVYENLGTVVMTSATLSVGHGFDYLYDRLGLELVSRDRVAAQEIDSPFDFQKQAMLGIVTDLPDPGAPGFQEASVACMREAIRCSGGHAFILFTSFFALDQAYRQLHAELRRDGLTPLRQGETGRTQLLERFRSEPSSVLFATDSFWEGVDVAGEALQCVILPKLPFRVPTEPILEARAEAIEAAGGNAFMDYALPQAVIKFRQGFGRLIRRRSDRGVVLVLDRRIVTKHYGRVFLKSLPPLRVVRGPQAAVLGEVNAFFQPTATVAAYEPSSGEPRGE
jgi:ATP-dependent DNA helicase DinG